MDFFNKDILTCGRRIGGLASSGAGDGYRSNVIVLVLILFVLFIILGLFFYSLWGPFYLDLFLEEILACVRRIGGLASSG